MSYAARNERIRAVYFDVCTWIRELFLEKRTYSCNACGSYLAMSDTMHRHFDTKQNHQSLGMNWVCPIMWVAFYVACDYIWGVVKTIFLQHEYICKHGSGPYLVALICATLNFFPDASSSRTFYLLCIRVWFTA